MTVSFETNAINGAIYFGATQDLLDLFGQGTFGRDVDGLAPERPGLVETLLIENLQEKDATWISDSVRNRL